MGKIVKYCAVCEESFSDKFSFCPNCAAALSAYEMNPLAAEARSIEPPVKIFEPSHQQPVEKFEPVTTQTVELAEPTVELVPAQEVETIAEPTAPSFLQAADNGSTDEILEIEDEKVEPIASTAPAITVPAVAAQSFESYQQTIPKQSGAGLNGHSGSKKVGEDGFYSVTFVEPKDSGTRNMLLLGATILVLGFSIISVVASIYNADAYVGALDSDLNNVVFAPTDELAEVEEPPKPKDDDDGGGGGGGGDKDPNPVSQGRLASQSEKPMIPPSAKMDQVTNPELVLRPETQGNRKEPPSTDPYGNPASRFNIASDGGGSGGGQGEGTGRGQGNGRGTGAGNGDGSGNGNGIGNGNGNGRGDGSGNDGDPPPPIKVGPTKNIEITSKPRANYTDAARQAQVQGTVTLRVTFNANGTIGSISAVNGLPNGLTEQAIAAARNIRFTPAMQNGVPKTVVKQVQYTFTLY